MEIEAKLKVDSFEPVLTRLSELGALNKAPEKQSDIYFDDAGLSLRKADKGLRLRIAESNGSEKLTLCYKGPREDRLYKTRDEIELTVTEYKAAVDFVSALGYQQVLTVTKNRQVWEIGNCEVALDEVDMLGKFVEIEGRSEKKISEVREKLGLDKLKQINETYACLLDEKLAKK